MSTSLTTVAAIALAAGIASPIGGLIALWRAPTTLFMSVALGFASGVLLATFAFEMLPKAIALSSLGGAALSFAAGFAALYAFDMFIHRGQMAGERSEQRARVARFYRRRRPRGSGVVVLAGGTSAEEVIEGLSIGIGTAVEPSLGLLVALAIVIDNLSEGLSVGELIRDEEGGGGRGDEWRRVLIWTGAIGGAVFVSALAGWLLLKDLPQPVLGWLFAFGAGGMFYLTVTDLVPEAEQRHFQQSAALATAAGFLLILVLSHLAG